MTTDNTQVIGSPKFVESCGAILFDLADSKQVKVCLIQIRASGTWHFAKGRRNQGESRTDAAIREVTEETGFRCRLLPLTMPTRATPPDSHPDLKDKAHVYSNLTEPIMCHIRALKRGQGTKIIWWYVAVREEDGDQGKLPGEANWRPKFMSCLKALDMLAFESDRALLRKAMELLEATVSVELPPISERNKNVGGVLVPITGATMSKSAAKRAVKRAKRDLLKANGTAQGGRHNSEEAATQDGTNDATEPGGRDQETKIVMRTNKRQKRNHRKGNFQDAPSMGPPDSRQ